MISEAIVGGELEALKKMQEALEKLKRKEADLRKRLAVLDDKLR